MTIIAGRRVESRLLPQDKWQHPDLPEFTNAVVLAFSTTVGSAGGSTPRGSDKTVLTGVGISDGLHATATANRVVAVLKDYLAKDKSFVLCLCADPETANMRARRALIELAEDGDALFIACKNTAVVDAVCLPRTFGLVSRGK